MEIDVFPKDVDVTVFGRTFWIRETYLTSLLLIALILIVALIIRFALIRRFTTDVRKIGKAQLLCEYLFNMLERFTKGAVGSMGTRLSPYILALAFYIILSGVIELFGLRTPLSDLSVTVSFGLSTFIIINYYGLREKGIIGRIRSYGKPKPIIAPFKLISDLATPVSLSCRMFGNILGGYIIMELLYDVLMSAVEKWIVAIPFAFIIPAVLSLYFTLFHVAIQFYIFSMLSLTFVNEAVEKEA